MALTTYRECSGAEKRAALRVFWTRRPDPSAKVNDAAREYAPYAFVLVGVVVLELSVIAVELVARATTGAWAAAAAAVLAWWGLSWTVTCRRLVARAGRDGRASDPDQR